MNKQFCKIIHDASRPLVPVATDQQEIIKQLAGIRAVCFDIYGTLFISASGDIGSDSAVQEFWDENDLSTDLEISLGSMFVDLLSEHDCNSEGMLECREKTNQSQRSAYKKIGGKLSNGFQQEICKEHKRIRDAGIVYPEIDVIEIWRIVSSSVCKSMGSTGDSIDLERLAIEYEIRTNPVWPMPVANDCIDRLASANLLLGIISNAQFYTPLLFPALMEQTLEELAFSSEMQYYSYQYGRAKPDEFLFREAVAGLDRKGIDPSESLYVGNDMLNDIMPAAKMGFRTALFAGDRRSLRLREGDSRVEGVSPDIVVKSLNEVARCVLKE